MLTTLCETGLPNFSRPSIVDPDELGCVILSPRRHVSGILITGFESSNFIQSDLPPAPMGGSFSEGTWWTCNQVKGCDERVEKQLSQPIDGLCYSQLASVTANGWATVTPGHYGHLGMYAREFFVDDVESVGPPPAALVKRMRAAYADAQLSDCD